ncbi:Golgi apparatus membrane protein [Salix suchowensis]|nr:Golgi apparatus membrane protein [Salix suchowensis]
MNPRISRLTKCLFESVFAGALAFYILSALFFNSFNVSGRILVGLRWWNEINDLGESVWKFQSLDQEAVPWIVLGIFSLIRLQADYCLIIGVCLTLSTANIVGFTKCRKGMRKKFQEVSLFLFYLS